MANNGQSAGKEKTYQDNRSKGFFVVLAGVFIMSFDPLLIRLSATDSWTTAFWFGALTFISMGIFIRVAEKINYLQALRENGFPLAVFALCMGGAANSLIISIKLTLAANTIVILSATPLLAAILSRIFLREHIPGRTWLAILACTGGVAIVFSGSLGEGSLLGDYFALQTTFFVACIHTLMRRYKQLSRAAAVGLGGFAVASISVFSAQPFGLSPESYIPLAILGLFSAPLGRVLMTTGPRYIPAPEVGLISLLNVFLAPLWVWLAFSETPSKGTLVGGAIIFLTLSLHSIMGTGTRIGKIN